MLKQILAKLQDQRNNDSGMIFIQTLHIKDNSGPPQNAIPNNANIIMYLIQLLHTVTPEKVATYFNSYMQSNYINKTDLVLN